MGERGMEREYRVAALDMDGTVLDDEKRMSEDTKAAIHQALAAGKEVIFCTGRSFAEMEDTLREFPDMHYLCGESGALVYDLRRGCPIRTVSMDKEAIRLIWKAIQGRDIMPQIFSQGASLGNRDQLKRMGHYQMGVYQEAFDRVCTPVDDLWVLALEPERSVEKLNLYHTSPAERDKTWEILKELEVNSTMVYSEISSLECSALGLSKAAGLQTVCEVLGISMDQVIMVGDADNDLEALRAAGLAVAMGNANENVKKVCQVQVADNNHDGCAQAIRQYLLGEKA